ncbi:hypothetical protein [Mycoplasmopsis synoviae]|nr:hypothetical protein MSHv_01900 [Mycoplasmopsis synoviae]AQU47987.1 hypothetical protein ADF19_01900 [Mycoplasmopsis synoviae]
MNDCFYIATYLISGFLYWSLKTSKEAVIFVNENQNNEKTQINKIYG